MAVEVHDKSGEHVLPSKVPAQEFVGTQRVPQDLLFRCRVPAQLPGQQALLPVDFSSDESHVIK